MVNVLLVRARHDLPTIYLAAYSQLLIDYAQQQGHQIKDLFNDLKDSAARLLDFEAAMQSFNPDIVIIAGHMNATTATGQDFEVLLKVGVNDDIMSGKICDLKGCSAGLELAPSMVSKTAQQVFSYQADFTFVYNPNFETRPLDDPWAKAFFDCMLATGYAILLGKTPKQVYEECYSEDTELLTTSGWKSYVEIQPDEKIFTLNPRTNEIEIENIKRKVIYDYDGKMYAFSSQQIDWLVTPNHRLWVKRYGGYSRGKFEFIEAKDLYGKEFRATKIGYWKNGEKFDKHFMRIIGYYLAEGCQIKIKKTKRYGICLSLANPQYIKKAMKSLKALGYHPFKSGYRVIVYSKQLWEIFAPLGHAWEKYIPEKYKVADRESLRILLNAYMEGDGTKNKNYWRARTVSPKLRDDLQEIALKAGWALNWCLDSASRRNWSPKLKRMIIGKHPCYYLGLIKKTNMPLTLSQTNKNRHKRTCEEWKHYTGKVWCVETINGILYVRRNGKASWSGNTIKRYDYWFDYWIGQNDPMADDILTWLNWDRSSFIALTPTGLYGPLPKLTVPLNLSPYVLPLGIAAAFFLLSRDDK